jgi:sarcosine oxidase
MYDVIVIGVGGMGSATVYHLARRNKKLKVLGLEQFNIPHDLGSSHGVNRIIRLAYAEHPNYVPLLRRSYELWRELEHTTKERLLVITGGIDAGTRESGLVTGSLESCKHHKIHREILEAKDVNRRFSGYSLPDGFVAVYQADAGFVLSERSIVAHVSAALELGAEIHGQERVIEWKIKNGNVEVRTTKGNYRARKLLITAGPWVSKLVQTLPQFAVPERQVLLWAQPKKPERYQPGVFPVFNMQAPEGRFYGFPIYGIPGFKIGKYHHRLENVDPDQMDRECHPEDEEVLREAIRHYFPDANGPTMALKTCLFTNTKDEHFMIDSHPEYPQVWLAAGFSGHGFKFCSVVGEIMANFALNGDPGHDISLFRWRP